MNVNDTTPEEKSEILFRLCGWTKVTPTMLVLVPPDGVPLLPGEVLNLYNPAMFELAWRVLNWAMSQLFYVEEWSNKFCEEAWVRIMDCAPGDNELFELPLADAQRLWLDKILQLAIAAGMVE